MALFYVLSGPLTEMSTLYTLRLDYGEEGKGRENGGKGCWNDLLWSPLAHIHTPQYQGHTNNVPWTVRILLLSADKRRDILPSLQLVSFVNRKNSQITPLDIILTMKMKWVLCAINLIKCHKTCVKKGTFNTLRMNISAANTYCVHQWDWGIGFQCCSLSEFQI